MKKLNSQGFLDYIREDVLYQSTRAIPVLFFLIASSFTDNTISSIIFIIGIIIGIWQYRIAQKVPIDTRGQRDWGMIVVPLALLFFLYLRFFYR